MLRHHRILSRALTVAVQRGHVPRNVAALVDPPAQRPSDLATALDLDEARAVLEAAATVRNSARWTVALALGLRQSEALALQWKDIDLLNNTLTVRRSIHRVRGGGLIYEEPKSKRSQRTLALPLPLVAELHRHKAAQLGERMLAGSEWHDEDLVFAQPNGRPIDKKTDYDDWTRLLQQAGVRHVRLHDGRHTAATLLLSENVHPRVVMELLGHSQMRTTMDIYSHVMPALAARRRTGWAPCCWQVRAGKLQPELQPRSWLTGRTTKKALLRWVELRGLEPLTPTLPVWCATSCATAPCRPGLVCPSRWQLQGAPDPAQGWRRPERAPPPQRRSQPASSGRCGGCCRTGRGARSRCRSRGRRLLGQLDALRLELGVGLVGVVAVEEQRPPEAPLVSSSRTSSVSSLIAGGPGRSSRISRSGSPGTFTVSQRMKPRSASVDLQPQLADVEVERLVLVEDVDLRDSDGSTCREER